MLRTCTYLTLFCAMIYLLAGAFEKFQSNVPANVIQPVSTDIEQDPKKWVWDTYRNYFGAYYAFEKYGVSSPIISIYTHNRHKFIPIESVLQRKILPKKTEHFWWKSWEQGHRVWWGARTMLLKASESQLKLGVFPYSSGSFGEAFENHMSVVDIRKGTIRNIQLTGKNVVSELTGDGEYTPSSRISGYFNSTSMNPEFVLGNRLIDSSIPRDSTELNLDDFSTVRRDNAVLNGPSSALLAVREQGQVTLVPMGKATATSVKNIQVPEAAAVRDRYPTDRSIYSLSDLDGDSHDELVVKSDGVLKIYLSSSGFEEALSITGTGKNNLGRAMLGAVGDFDGDGANDFWLIDRAEKPGFGAAYLFSGEGHSLDLTLNDAKCTLRGSNLYSDVDAIGSTFSPVAGDFDGDRIPDFSIGGHFNMSFSGTLYILPGREIRKSEKCSFSVTSKRVVKILGEAFSELAPTGLHYDHFDVNRDGFDDIIVSADNDLQAGFASGAVLVLDGKKIAEKTK